MKSQRRAHTHNSCLEQVSEFLVSQSSERAQSIMIRQLGTFHVLNNGKNVGEIQEQREIGSSKDSLS